MEFNAFQIYLILINIATCTAFVIDKDKAKRGARRISEKTLLGMSLIGGSLGGYLAMKAVRHKTQKPAFKFGMPIILIIQIALGTIFL